MTVNEGDGTLTFTVSLDNPIDIPVEVAVEYFEDTATPGDDFDDESDTVTFGAGSTVSQTVNVDITNDQFVETAIETFLAGLGSATEFDDRDIVFGEFGIGSITENDRAVITFSGTASLNEGNATPGFVNATLSLVTDGTGPAELEVPVSATIGSPTGDFTASTVTFDTGESSGSQSMAVTVINDRSVEQAIESLSANLTPSSAAIVEAAGSALVSITENDTASVAITSPGTTSLTEGGSSANVGVSLNLLTNGTGAIQLGVPISVNLPMTNADYTPVAATFAAGSVSGATANIVVSAVDDAIVEAAESFAGQAFSATSDASVGVSGVQTINVADNDAATFTIGDVSVSEGGTATFTISLNNVLDIPITIDVSYGGGTATGGGVDYDSATDQVTFAAGSTAAQTVTVVVTDDSFDEPTETFVASLGTSTSLGGRSVVLTDTGVGTIIDGDSGAPTVADRSFTLAEDTSMGGTLTATDPDNDSVTFSIVSGPAHGTVNLDAQTGAFTYTPAADYHGGDSFTYQASDGGQFSNTATVSLTITPVNDAPVANAGTASTNEDTDLVGSVSVTDVDNATLTYSVVSGPAHGGLVFDTLTGAFTYTPDGNYNGSDSFTFKANDSSVDSNTATFSITVNAVNDAPVAIDASNSTNEDTTLIGSVTAFDIDGNPLTLSLVSGIPAAAGTLTLNSNGTYVFTPAADFSGSATFTFQANDGTVNSNIAAVSLTVNAVNDAPLAIDDSATTNEDTPFSDTMSATDVDSASLTYTVLSGPSHGQLTLATGTGAFTYTPDANFNGSDTFTFRVNDGSANSNIATFSITVVAVNDAPVADPGSVTTNEDTTLTGAVTATDVDGNPLTYSLVSGPAPAAGTVTVAANGTFVFTPAANFNGSASFTFKASDGSLDSNTATVNITVNAVNDAPVAAAGNVSTNEDSSVTGTVSATDVDNPSLTYSVVSGPTHGTLDSFNPATGEFTYTPAANYNGPDSFTFKANDGSVDSNTATFSIAVNAVNDAPVAASATASTNEDAVLVGAVSATDVDGNPLTYSLVSGPPAAAGTVTVAANGTFVFTPALNFNGSTSFTFQANDGAANSNTATINITVAPVNDAPVANAGSTSTNEDVAVSGTLAATDVDAGAVLTYSIVAGPAHGTISGFNSATGAFTYTPAANYNGPDSFTFKANDSTVDSNVATFSVNIAPVNDNPTANADNLLVGEDSGLNSLNVLANDSSAPDGVETLTITATTPPSHGTVAIGPGGLTVHYTPAPNYNGPDLFTYTISDGNGGTAVATVNITVAGANDLPTAVNDTATAIEDGGATTINVLANDLFTPDVGETLTIVSVTQGQHGTVTIVPGNLSLTYTPAANFAGSDTFLYTISDGNGGTSIAAVVVEVTNDAADRLEVITTSGVTIFTEPLAGPAVAVVVDGGIKRWLGASGGAQQGHGSDQQPGT